MEVRIRSTGDTDSRFLTEIPFRPEVIDSIIPTLASWGVVSSFDNIADLSDMSGQFRDDGNKAYFEIVIGPDA